MHHIFQAVPIKKQPNIDEIIAGLVSRAVEGQTTQIDQSCLKHILQFQKTPMHSDKIMAAIMNEIDHKGEKSLIVLKCLSLIYTCISSSENFVLAAKKFIPEIEAIHLLAYPSKDRYQPQLHTIARHIYLFLINKAELPKSFEINKVEAKSQAKDSRKFGKSQKRASNSQNPQEQKRVPAAFTSTIQDTQIATKNPTEIENLLSFDANDSYRNDDLFSPMAPFTPKTQTEDLLSTEPIAPNKTEANFISFDDFTQPSSSDQKSSETNLFDFNDNQPDGFAQLNEKDNGNSSDDDLLGEFGGPDSQTESEHSRSHDIFSALDAKEREEEQNLLDTNEIVEVKPASTDQDVKLFDTNQIEYNDELDLFSPINSNSSNIVKNGASNDGMFNPFDTKSEPISLTQSNSESIFESNTQQNSIHNDSLLNDNEMLLGKDKTNSFELFESIETKQNQQSLTNIQNEQQKSNEFNLFESNQQKGSNEFNPFDNNETINIESTITNSMDINNKNGFIAFSMSEQQHEIQSTQNVFDVLDGLNSNESNDFQLFDESINQNSLHQQENKNDQFKPFNEFTSQSNSTNQTSKSPKNDEFNPFGDFNSPQNQPNTSHQSKSEQFNPFGDFNSPQNQPNTSNQSKSQQFNPFDDLNSPQQPQVTSNQSKSQQFNPFDDLNSSQNTKNDQFDMLNGFNNQSSSNLKSNQESDLFGFSTQQYNQKSLPGNTTDLFDSLSGFSAPTNQLNKQPQSQTMFNPFMNFSSNNQQTVPQKQGSNMFGDFSNFTDKKTTQNKKDDLLDLF